MIEELCCAMNRDSLQIRLEGDNANEIFKYEGFRVFRVAKETPLMQKDWRYRCVHRF